LNLQASVDIGSATSRIVVELIESEDLTTNTLRPATLTAAATTGGVYLDLTGRRRDGDTGPFTVFVDSITAGGGISVLLEAGRQPPRRGPPRGPPDRARQPPPGPSPHPPPPQRGPPPPPPPRRVRKPGQPPPPPPPPPRLPPLRPGQPHGRPRPHRRRQHHRR